MISDVDSLDVCTGDVYSEEVCSLDEDSSCVNPLDICSVEVGSDVLSPDAVLSVEALCSLVLGSCELDSVELSPMELKYVELGPGVLSPVEGAPEVLSSVEVCADELKPVDVGSKGVGADDDCSVKLGLMLLSSVNVDVSDVKSELDSSMEAEVEGTPLPCAVLESGVKPAEELNNSLVDVGPSVIPWLLALGISAVLLEKFGWLDGREVDKEVPSLLVLGAAVGPGVGPEVEINSVEMLP